MDRKKIFNDLVKYFSALYPHLNGNLSGEGIVSYYRISLNKRPGAYSKIGLPGGGGGGAYSRGGALI